MTNEWKVGEKHVVCGDKMMVALFETEVGSRMWGMERPDSDYDKFVVYIAPTRDILIGHKHKSYQQKSDYFNTDYAIHEIGKVINMLVDNNVNFIWGVTSTSELSGDERIKDELESLTRKLLSKRIYGSVHGLAVHNIKKYIETDKENTSKKRGIIIRTLEFGIRVLNEGRIDFEPASSNSEKYMYELLQQIDEVRDNSHLPDKPEQRFIDEAHDWLEAIRLSQLK